MPSNYLSMVWRFVSGERGLFPNENLRNLLKSNFPEGVNRFGDIEGAELYITAVDLETCELHVFGIDRSESVLDAIMASCALPFFLPPWQYRGRHYVDGGIISDLPIRVATRRGATRIYAIDVGIRRAKKLSTRGMFRTIWRVVDAVAHQQVLNELDWARTLTDVDIRYIHLDAFQGVRIWDFSRTEDMIEEGRRVGQRQLRMERSAR